VFQAVGLELKLRNYDKRKPFLDFENREIVLQMELLRSNSRLGSLIILSGKVHTGGESLQDGLGVV